MGAASWPAIGWVGPLANDLDGEGEERVKNWWSKGRGGGVKEMGNGERKKG